MLGARLVFPLARTPLGCTAIRRSIVFARLPQSRNRKSYPWTEWTDPDKPLRVRSAGLLCSFWRWSASRLAKRNRIDDLGLRSLDRHRVGLGLSFATFTGVGFTTGFSTGFGCGFQGSTTGASIGVSITLDHFQLLGHEERYDKDDRQCQAFGAEAGSKRTPAPRRQGVD